MKNLPFVLWTLLFLPMMQIEDFISVKVKLLRNLPVQVDKDVLVTSTIVITLIWIMVAYLLYER